MNLKNYIVKILSVILTINILQSYFSLVKPPTILTFYQHLKALQFFGKDFEK